MESKLVKSSILFFFIFLLILAQSFVLVSQEPAPPAANQGGSAVDEGLARLKKIGELAVDEGKTLIAIKYFTEYRNEAEKAGNVSAATDASIKLVETFCRDSSTLPARSEYDRLVKKYPGFLKENPLFADRLEYFNCWILILEKKNGDAVVALNNLLKKADANNVFHYEILDKLALAAVKEGDWKQAEKYYAVLASPSATAFSQFAENAKTSRNLCIYMIGDEKVLNEIAVQNADGSLPQSARLVKLLLLIKAKKLKEAMVFFDEQKAVVPGEDRHLWYFAVMEFANSLRKAGMNEDAAKMLENAKILSSSLGKSESEDSCLALIDLYSTFGNKDNLLAACEYFRRNFPNSSRIFDVTMMLAGIYSDKIDVKNMQENYLWVIKHPSVPVALKTAAILESAEKLLKCQDYNASRELLKTYLAELSENTELRAGAELLLAQALFLEGKLDDAAKYFEIISGKYPRFPQIRKRALYFLVKTLFKKGNYANVVKMTEEVIVEFKDKDEMNRDMMLYLADSKYEMGEKSKSISIYRDFAAAYPEDPGAPEALVKAASVCIEEKDLAGAEKLLQEVIHTYSKSDFHPVGLYNMIFVQILKNDDVGIGKVLDSVLENMKGNQLFYPSVFAVIDYYRDLGKYDKAISLIIRVLEIYTASLVPATDPKSKPEEKLRVSEKKNPMENPEVKNVNEKESRPLSEREWIAKLLYEKAFIEFKQKKLDDALKTIDTIFAEFPEGQVAVEAYFLQGDIFSEKNEFDKAVFAYNEVGRLRPESAFGDAALARSAECLFTTRTKEGNLEKATEINARLLKKKNISGELKEHLNYNLGRCLEESGNIDDALDRYTEIIYSYKIDSEQHKVRDPLWLVRAARAAAKIYREKGNPDAYGAAAAIFDHLVELEIEPVDEFKKEKKKYMEKLKLK